VVTVGGGLVVQPEDFKGVEHERFVTEA
jgi:hypothetical protein